MLVRPESARLRVACDRFCKLALVPAAEAVSATVSASSVKSMCWLLLLLLLLLMLLMLMLMLPI
jgi:hypothetical protein